MSCAPFQNPFAKGGKLDRTVIAACVFARLIRDVTGESVGAA